ncbi:amiloride-sensitive sodium channel subunit gamma [Patella vulgata]|uniref:amiloride-sensitive sodium channel subunit gamma n=1 Tax=Patella vulgata TaxID=6465 RepID=UPI0021800501|nr:amiloride-sensitive sodium channel subunit gamma [Patella vulgata]
MLDDKQQSVKGLVKDFAANSSMHGWPKAAESKGNFRRFMWIILTLIGSGIAIQHVAKIIILYNQWPLSTVVTIENNNKLDFPAVTICNMNPAKRSTLKSKVEELGFHDLVDLINIADERRKEEENSEEEEEVVEEENDEENTADFYEALTAEYNIESAFISVIGAMNTTDRQMIGHAIEDMLIACTYEGRPCSARNFTSFYNFKYGNCYTFNGNPDISPRKLETKKPGPRYGLTMELYIQETEYSEFLADTLGAKILVHHQGSMPFPEDDGVSISPGMSTSVGLSQVILERSKPPHGRCKSYTEEHNKEINVFAEFNNVSYSEKACMKTCYQKNVIKECKCCHFDFPCDGQALDEVLVDITETPVRRCNETIDGKKSVDVTYWKMKP